MHSLSGTVISILSTTTLIGQIIAVLLVLLLLFRKIQPKDKTSQKLMSFIRQNYVVLIFVVSAIATVGSLTLSDVLNFAPCKLCWYQRIAMYPQVVISLVALLTNDLKVRKYVLPIAAIGFLISVYHILLQLFPNALQCNDEVAKCSAVQFAQYGYITIPVMACTAFGLIILFGLMSFATSAKK